VRVLPPSSGCKPLRITPGVTFRVMICGEHTELEDALGRLPTTTAGAQSGMM
jgi:hypothetical protein